MWLLNRPPTRELEERYGFVPTTAWLEHVQKSSLRFNNGGSGAWVSSTGLIVTNHHVIAAFVEKLSSPARNLLQRGYLARTAADELKCDGLEVNVLLSIQDVTARINSAVPPGASPAQALAARRAARSAVEKESSDRTGLKSDVVALYQGNEYHLYHYKRYTDVRLVFAPEQAVAFFGGDPDNFEFPRFDLDVAFLRAYEDGQPVRPEHFFKLQPSGVQENELVFVTGHPGTTNRLLTVAELEFNRDVRIPTAVAYLNAKEVALSSWAERSVENARIAERELVATRNARKVFDNRQAALLDRTAFERKRRDEESLIQFAKDHAEWGDAVGAWAQLAEGQRVSATYYKRKYLLEMTSSEAASSGGRLPLSFDSTLASMARVLFRASTEKEKPDGQRLPEFRDANLPTLEFGLFSNEQVDLGLEEVKLTVFLTHFAQQLGADDPLVKAALDGKTPAARASELIRTTAVRSVELRRQFYAFSAAEMRTLDDPLILFVRALDAASREVRTKSDESTETKLQARGQIARVRYARDGGHVYPDATFTLRLAFGTTKPYQEQGAMVPVLTRLGDLFNRSDEHGGRAPFELPKRWVEARRTVNADVPYNFVSTCDIIGGNSGSSTLNRAGEWVGVVFDTNRYGAAGDYVYSDEQARAISVDVRGVMEVLNRIYHADTLVEELQRAD